jgi:hypothetical protein
MFERRPNGKGDAFSPGRSVCRLKVERLNRKAIRLSLPLSVGAERQGELAAGGDKRWSGRKSRSFNAPRQGRAR